MNYLAFILFVIAFSVWLCLHLAAAYWAVRRLPVSPPDALDVDFVRVRDFHAREVREGRRAPEVEARDFASAPKWSTEGVVFSRGDCLLRCGTRVGGVVSTARLTLKDGVQVATFADSQSELEVRQRCFIAGRATSGSAIRIGDNSRARSFYAPKITTTPQPSAPRRETGVPAAIPPAEGEDWSESGLARKQLRRLSEGAWIYMDSFRPGGPVKIGVTLIVLGDIDLPAGSVVREDLKATGNIRIGADSICHGRIVADGNIRIGDGTRFDRTLYAGGDVFLCSGAHGGADVELVVYARGRAVLEHSVVVHGKIASGLEVVCSPQKSL